jgi:hypothetical protein
MTSRNKCNIPTPNVVVAAWSIFDGEINGTRHRQHLDLTLTLPCNVLFYLTKEGAPTAPLSTRGKISFTIQLKICLNSAGYFFPNIDQHSYIGVHQY